MAQQLPAGALALIPVSGLPMIAAGDDLAGLIVVAAGGPQVWQTGDILVVAQKVVSKAEGRTVDLTGVDPSPRALELAAATGKDSRLVELILQESREVVRTRPGLIVVEDTRGFICANAGIDRSNIEQHGDDDETVALLPLDPDASAAEIRRRVLTLTGADIGVIINDSHGRAFREGTVGVAIGLSGTPALWDRRGDADLTGYTLQHTVIAIGDEIAAAASLLMGPAAEGIPAVIVRGLLLPAGESSARELQRPRSMDLFR
ncbi:MAG TPA: coenzyme F420-0:L-glutamate ligase [Chloroflexota bacterium]|nr:coenzyme F420-0:L-glutamate ligase [Chloroflexota bacterium]